MICIDSDCIIDFLKGKKEAIEVIEKNKEELVTTEINVFEIFVGSCSIADEEKAVDFFNSLEILNTDGWGYRAAKIFCNLLKKGEALDQNDCLIASIMLTNNCNKIITNNKKHFSRIKEIEIISY